ncbi:MAG: choice-of-anchor D domain-containing protein, partial [Saprospiraceae bacterium]|nr:choice-of-anchor D domain-containing protein [Saprospiraceae bacterium]
ANFTLANGSPSSIAIHSGTGVSGSGPYTFSPSGAGPGVHTITYTGTDANGCSNTCNYTITVGANATPSISGAAPTCVGDMVQLSGTPNVSGPATLQSQAWMSSDNGIATVDGTGKVTGVSYGTVTITYTVTDSYGCTGSSSVMITVQQPEMAVSCGATNIADGDNTPSTGECTDFGCVNIDNCMVENTFTITNSGDCPLVLDGAPAVVVNGIHAADFTVTLQATTPVAGSGGTTTFKIKFDPSATGLRSATVVISNNDADENPFTFEIQGTGSELLINTCPPTANIEGCNTDAIATAGHPAYSETEQTVSAAVFAAEGGVFTNTCGTTTFKYIDSKTGTCPTVVTRLWTITDVACGTTRTCNQTINVDDNTNPTITCPANNLTLECVDGANYVAQINTWIATATASDVCDLSVAITTNYDGTSVPPLSCELATGLTITFTATDDCNNQSQCMRTVYLDDTANPSITCPANNLTLECVDGANYVAQINAWIGTATATDACDQTVTITTNYNGTSVPALSCDLSSVVSIRFKAWDDCNNQSQCMRTVYLDDSANPSITCPANNLTLECVDGANYVAQINTWI